MANPKYSKSEDSIPTLTPFQWDKQNLSKGYVAHPGYTNGKKKLDQYKEYYNPAEFAPKLTKDGIYQWSNLKDPNYDFSNPTNLPVQRYQPPSVNVSPEVDPNVKPLQFTPSYTLNPNTGIATLPNGQLVDPTMEYKKGGLVKGYKKAKKYADGGGVDADQAAIIGTGLSSLSDLGQGIGSYNLERKAFKPKVDPLEAPEFVQQNKNTNLGQGIGSAAGTGLGFGAGVTLTALTGGAAAPLIPVLTGLGQKAGSFTGKLIGSRYDRKNSKNQFKDDTNLYNETQILADQQAKYQTNLANQLATRNTYKDGGKIVGKGTGKSDSIKAKVKKDSFVIPVEKADVGKKIIKEVLGDNPDKKANLKQDGGEKVKLSNGEMLLDPNQVKELEEKGVNVDALAPDADKDKMLADGGKVKDDPFKTIRERTIKAQREADIQELNTLTDEYKTLKAKSTNGNPIDKSAYNRRIVDLANRMKQITDKQGLNTSSIPTKTGAEVEKILKEPVVKSGLSKATPVTSSIPSSNPAISNLNKAMANQDVDNAVIPPVASTGLGKAVAKPQSAIDDAANLAPYEADLATRLAETTLSTTSKISNGTRALNGLSTLVNYGVPIAQTAIGLNYLKKAGDRPVDQIDPIFQQTLNNANTRASYGFTPEENALLTNQNNNLTSAQRFAARNYSGGNAGNAYNMERDAINESFGRGLSSAVQNRQLQLNKQQYADQIGLNKVELSRRLFNDKLGAFKENQAAYGNLVNTGLSNLVSANRYEQEKRAMADRGSNYNNIYGV